MPGSITLGLLLFFLFIYLPVVFARLGLRNFLPLKGYPPHFDDEFRVFYLPAILIQACTALIFQQWGYTLSDSVLLAALGDTKEFSQEALIALKNGASTTFFCVFTSCTLSYIYGLYRGLRTKRRILELRDNSFELGRSHGLYDPWYRLFLVTRSGTTGTINIDVWTKGRILYSGHLKDYHLSKDGEFTGLTLASVKRHIKDPLEPEMPQQSAWESKAVKEGSKRIPGNLMHFFASDISNFNLRWVKAIDNQVPVVATDLRTSSKDFGLAKQEMLKYLLEIKEKDSEQ